MPGEPLPDGERVDVLSPDEMDDLMTQPFDIPPTPCELLEPVMRGIMARELADTALFGKGADDGCHSP